MYHTDILDTDLYKLTMQMAICRLYPRVKARYTFINRDGREFPAGFGNCLREIIDGFKSLKLTTDGRDFIREKCYYLDPLYIDFLAGYRYNPKEVTIEQECQKLIISIEGYWYRTVLWEVPLMETISELYFEMTKQGDGEEILTVRNKAKAEALDDAGAKYSEFGTRRRKSFINQNNVIISLKKNGRGSMLGTSNVYFAMTCDLIPMGTQAHEWTQYHGARYGYKMANEMALEAWTQVYQGDLGTALSDTFTTDVFLKSFGTKYAKLFDGVRQDSGDPLVFVEKIIKHYEKMRVNPLFKMAMFSDNLKSTEQIKAIHDACNGRIIDRYGIGTWLSNDCGVKPLNMVIKLTEVDFGQGRVPTVKLSDDIGKNTGDSTEVTLCKQVLGIGA